MTTEEKQNFLREKILDKGYDTNQFVQFLTEKKGEDGADVSNWSMEDLVSVVNEFVKLHGGQVEEEVKKPEPKVEQKKVKVSMFDIMGGAKPKKNISQPLPNPQKNPQIETQKVNSQPQTQTQNQPKVQKPQTTIKPTYNNTNANNNMTGAESEYGIITQNIKDCKPLEQTELAKFDNLEITISKPEKKTEGFFSKTYVTYMVTTLPASYIVRRRYTDFVWLRSTLQNHFPSNVIPPIPKKSRLVGDNFSTQFISKRQRGLEKFMRYLAKDPIIKNSQIFFDFLYIGAESDFNRTAETWWHREGQAV